MTNEIMLPDGDKLKTEMAAINKFQQIVHSQMVKNQDYGVIPGTSQPTLLKPGAEKITKILGLSDHYEIADRQEEWKKPFFRYLLKCTLIHMASGRIFSEGLGECNSMESKYRWRWVFSNDVPASLDKAELVKRNIRNGGVMYRTENDDIYSQVNTILKMAKKRALVDAALSAGRLSNVFTQDIEDMPEESIVSEPAPSRLKPEPARDMRDLVPPVAPTGRATSKQLGTLHALISKKGYDRDVLIGHCQIEYGIKESSKELTVDQAEALIDLLQTNGQLTTSRIETG